MKINEPIRHHFEDTRLLSAERSANNTASFQKIMRTISKDLTQDRLHQLLQDVDTQGQHLSENPTFNELRKYKNLVKQFMGEVSKSGIGLYQTETWEPLGGSKTLKTVRTIDRQLIELTDHVISQQSNSLSILERIGEIKGLLLNLYT